MKTMLSSPMLKDVRGALCAVAAVFSVLGFIALDLTGHTADAQQLLTTVCVPSLAFLYGFGSDPKSDDSADAE